MSCPPLIHIGYPKTGTTWLQSGIFSSSRFGFSPVGGAPKFFGVRFIYGEEGGLGHPFDFSAEELRQDYEKLTAGSGYPVISHEALLCHPYSGGSQTRDIALKIRDVFPDAKILITIREQREMIISLYEHYLRMGGVASLEKFVGAKFHQSLFPSFDIGFLEYDKCVRFYSSLFGQKNVLVLPFELIRNDSLSFLSSIYDFAGINTPSKEWLSDLEKQEAKNVSNPNFAFAQYHFRLLNLLGKPSGSNAFSAVGYKPLSTALFKLASALTPKNYALRYRQNVMRAADLLVGDAYLESNRRTQSLTGLDLAVLGYRI